MRTEGLTNTEIARRLDTTKYWVDKALRSGKPVQKVA
jgi:transcriptional regulator